jgi:hypothetical protein
MDIKLDPELIRDAVSSAVLQSLDENKRNSMIEAALKHLLTPSGDAYRKGESPLQTAFNNALSVVARDIAQKTLEDNAEVKEKIMGLLNEAFTRVMDANREQTILKLAEAITKGLTVDQYR